ncbi:related to urease accessory protein UreD [Rhynchosporium secalis]|uniref:Related to urease accessory protein UreD n=1 Tax=Rhynchosporium secalis TaxID=38038 RepID=A0A1E1LUD8_RHYSE|nr:related to urease accessory protein UreD [Rhynchosporium secalis]
MGSPFPPSLSFPGEGHLVVQLLPQKISGLSTISFQYPLKLISPSPSASQKSVLVFLLTYGGGLVGGDQVNLTIEVKPHARLSIVTQGHTKIFKSPSRDVVTRQRMDVTIREGAGVCLLPDPVQPFEGSVYEQTQKFFVHEGGSLCLLDWVSEGRTARGEDWDLRAWRGRNEVWLRRKGTGKDRMLLRDNVILEGDSPEASEKALRMKMHKLGIFGTLVLRGPMMDPLGAFFMAEFAVLPRIGARDFRSQEKVERDSGVVMTRGEAWRIARLKQEKVDQVLWSAATVRGCTVVKFGARTVEGGRVWIGGMLQHEGSISQCFGDDALMCVK